MKIVESVENKKMSLTQMIPQVAVVDWYMRKRQIVPIKSSDMTMNETNYNKLIPTIFKNYSLKKLDTEIWKQRFTSDIIINILV